MDRKTLLLLLVAILVTVASVPALAGQKTTVTPSLDRKSLRGALTTARRALRTARTASSNATFAQETAKAAADQAAAAKAAADAAQGTANAAQGTANSAQSTANGAQSTAAATQALLESTRVKSAMTKAEAGTESESFVQLPGGPSLTATAPSSGLIEVWAQATIEGGGAVSLFEDGHQMPGQAELCSHENGGALFAAFGGPEPEVVSTPASNGFCGTQGAPGPVMFETTPGPHEYELRYGTCGCPEEVLFSNRLLRVGPRL
jgi:hypothetical protein